MIKKLLFTLFLVFIQSMAFAITKTYNGPTNGSWNTASNWSSGVIPTALDDAIIPSGKNVNILANSFANSLIVAGILTVNSNIQLTVSGNLSISGSLMMSNGTLLTALNNFTVNFGGSFYMPTGSGLATLVVYGNYNNNGFSDFWKSTVVIAGDLISPTTSSIQNNGNVVVGGNIIGSFNTTGGNGSNQIYAVNPYATVTITDPTINSNVIPGTTVANPPETQTLIDLINLVIYGGNCSFLNNTANATACLGSNVVFTTTTSAGAPIYKWQVNKNDGMGWNDLPNSAPYSGVTTSNLTITNVAAVMNNYKYRANVTSAGCSKDASYGVLTVSAGISAPALGIIKAATCGFTNGSVDLSGLPSAGTWTLTMNGTLTASTTGTGSTATMSNLAPGTYTFTVTNGTCISASSANAVLTKATNTWNGISWSTGSAPTNSDDLVISGNYSATSNVVGCSLTITSSATVVINSPFSITLGSAVTVTSGSLTIKSGAGLIQTNNAAVNSGNIFVERLTTVRKTDYVYWSSPVANFSSAAICPTTNIYKWNPSVANSNGGQGNWQGGNETMTLGKGYIVRGPNTYTATAAPFTAVFAGVPNNGIIQPSITRGTIINNIIGINSAIIGSFDDNWNLIGNPYPSAIDAMAFLTANTNIAGNVRLWTHGTAITAGGSTFYGNFLYNYSTGDYVNYNSLGSTPPGFNGKIASGQSFFVSMNEATAVTESVTFNNSMRSSIYGNTQFYRSTADAAEQTSRIWISLMDANNIAATTLIGYADGATYDKDRMFDAPNPLSGTTSSIYSLINSEPMIIQGRPTPFDNADIVPLGVTISTTGTYTIAIGELDGLFGNQDQNIYLEDTVTGTVSNLRIAPYSFTATAGTYNNRFLLKYTNTLLGIDTVTNNQTAAFICNHQLKVQSNDSIEKVEVFDISGKLINSYLPADLKNQYEAAFNFANGVYFAKIKLENGITVSKKLIN